MLRKIESWLKKNLKKKEEAKIQRGLQIQNHIVDINGTDYYFGKGSITDIPDIVNVEEEVYDKKAAWDRERFLNDLKKHKNSLYMVIRKADELIAFVGCYISRDSKNCHVENIAVLPKFQNRGLGYFLLTMVIRRARLMKLRSVSVETRLSNIKVQDLNRDLGFIQVGIDPDYYNDGEDAVVMKLDLSKQKVAPNNFGR